MLHRHHSTRPRNGAERASLYCPYCKTSGKGTHAGICEACGERLIPQGYCTVCDNYWRLPVQALCPKHDVPLESGPPHGPEFDAEARPLNWVTVAGFTDTQAAYSARIRLEAEGIPTFLDGERMGSRAMYNVATGGVRLKVPDTLAADARVLLSQTWSATAAVLDIVELPGEDDEPEELSEEYPALRRSILFFILVGLPALALAALLLWRFVDR